MTYHAKVVDGQFALPFAVLEEAGIHDGDLLVIEVDPQGGISVKTRLQVTREVQAEFRAKLPPGTGSLVDELIADRRAEAAREEAEAEDMQARPTR